MTKEVYIYISLFVVMLGYLVYMDYREKTAAYPSLTKETISGDICVTAEDLGKITKYDMDTNADQIKVPPRRILCPVCGETTFLCPEHCGNSPCVHGASGEKHKLGCLLSLSSKELAGLKKYYEENK